MPKNLSSNEKGELRPRNKTPSPIFRQRVWETGQSKGLGVGVYNDEDKQDVTKDAAAVIL